MSGATKFAADKLVYDTALKYGVDVGKYLTHSKSKMPMLPTELGKRINVAKPLTPQDVNVQLFKFGYQDQIGKKWIPTPKGERFCEYNRIENTKAFKAPTQILWYENILIHLKNQMNLYAQERYEAARDACMSPEAAKLDKPF